MRLFGDRGGEHLYPPYVITPAERERWDLSLGIATQMFGDVGSDHVWMAARSIYRGPIPTRACPDRGDPDCK